MESASLYPASVSRVGGSPSRRPLADHLNASVPFFALFSEERLAEARRKTVETMQQYLQVFIELKGDLPVSKLWKPLVREFIKEHKDYPAHRNHGRWKRMSLADIRAAGKKPVSVATQHNIVGNLHPFAEWLVEVKELDSNPFEIKLPNKPKAPEPDRTWTEAELKLVLFGSGA